LRSLGLPNSVLAAKRELETSSGGITPPFFAEGIFTMGFRYQLLGWLKKIIIGCFQLPLSIFIVLAGFVIGIVVFKLGEVEDKQTLKKPHNERKNGQEVFKDRSS